MKNIILTIILLSGIIIPQVFTKQMPYKIFYGDILGKKNMKVEDSLFVGNRLIVGAEKFKVDSISGVKIKDTLYLGYTGSSAYDVNLFRYAANVLGSLDTAYLPGINLLNKIHIRPAASGNWIMTLPANDGDPGEYLKTDGNGNLLWDTVNIGGTYLPLSAGSSKPLSDALYFTGQADIRAGGTSSVNFNYGSGGSGFYFHGGGTGTDFSVTGGGNGYFAGYVNAVSGFKKNGNALALSDIYSLPIKIADGGTNATSISTGYWLYFDGSKIASSGYSASDFVPSNHTVAMNTFTFLSNLTWDGSTLKMKTTAVTDGELGAESAWTTVPTL